MGGSVSTSNDARASAKSALSGSIRWEVDKDSISGKSNYSPAIELGGMKWRLNAYNSLDGKHLGVFVNQMDGDYTVRNVDVNVQIKLVDHDYDAYSLKPKFSCSFNPTMSDYGFPCLIRWNDGEGFIKDNKIILEAEFSLSNIKGFRKVPRMAFTDPNEPSHDVTLVIEGEKIYASKQYLSILSPVFHNMFYGELIEKNQKEFELKDINYKEFVEFLNVIYPPSKRIIAENVESLLKLGDQFMIGEVMDKAEQYLIDSYKFTHAAKLLLADRYRLQELQDQCLDKLKTIKNLKVLKNSSEFKDFSDAIHATIYLKMLNLVENA